jgi:hypothetical protein
MRIAQPNVERAASDVGRGACEAAQASDVDGESYRRGRHRRRRRRRRRRRATAQAGAAAAIVRRGPDAGWTTEGIGAEAQGAGRAAQRRASSSPRASAESAGAHPRTTPRASMGRPLSPSRPHVSERCPECPRLRPREAPRKHREYDVGLLDPCSSGPWFTGWSHALDPPVEPSPVEAPATWVLRKGWSTLGGGPIRLGEVPRALR